MRHKRHWPHWEDDPQGEESGSSDRGAPWPGPPPPWRAHRHHWQPGQPDDQDPWKAWHDSWEAWHKHRRRTRRARWQHRPTVVFVQFAGLFGFMAVFLCGGVAALVFIIRQLWGGTDEVALMARAAAIGLMLALPLLVVLMARRAFSNIAIPLADIMEAADAVAEGLSLIHI